MEAIAEPSGIPVSTVERPDFRTRFTSERAKALSAKATAARKAKRLERLGLTGASKGALSPSEARLQAQITRLEGLMGALEAKMTGCNDDVRLRNLSQAHDRLFNSWCTLTGTPRPGVRKVGKQRSPVSITSLPDPLPIVSDTSNAESA